MLDHLVAGVEESDETARRPLAFHNGRSRVSRG